ncbi:MAG: hypothetical protein E7B68_10155 [Streptococcus salivarius]|nr:hypothetical protein [Streptococcus salivarius]
MPTDLIKVITVIIALMSIELCVFGCQRLIAKKLGISKEVTKKYKFFLRIAIVLLSVPIIIFGLLPMLGISLNLFNGSDVLGYYGALIGGGVTVLGVYFTFKYERMILAEERKEESLPILMFSLRELTEEECKNDNTLYDLEVIRGVEVYEKYDMLKKEITDLEWELESLDSQRTILLEERDENNANEDITKYERKAKSNKICRELRKIETRVEKINTNLNIVSNNLSQFLFVESSYYLEIKNIGLQTAILSSISLCSQGGISSRVLISNRKLNTHVVKRDKRFEELLLEDEITNINIFAVPKDATINIKINFLYNDYKESYSNKGDWGPIDNDKGDYFLIEFTDVYLNRYRYKLPITLRYFFGLNAVNLDDKRVPVLPEKIRID